MPSSEQPAAAGPGDGPGVTPALQQLLEWVLPKCFRLPLVVTPTSAVKTPPKYVVRTPPDQNTGVKTCRPPSKYLIVLMGGGASWFLLSKHEICCEGVKAVGNASLGTHSLAHVSTTDLTLGNPNCNPPFV